MVGDGYTHIHTCLCSGAKVMSCIHVSADKNDYTCSNNYICTMLFCRVIGHPRIHGHTLKMGSCSLSYSFMFSRSSPTAQPGTWMYVFSFIMYHVQKAVATLHGKCQCHPFDSWCEALMLSCRQSVRKNQGTIIQFGNRAGSIMDHMMMQHDNNYYCFWIFNILVCYES